MDSPQKQRVCISLCEQTLIALELAIARAVAESDLIEVRLDCFDPLELETESLAIESAVECSGAESILTFRPAEQGGRLALDYAARYLFWNSRIAWASNNFFDIELDVVEGLASSNPLPLTALDWSRIICSHHDYVGVPANLNEIYRRMAGTPAHVLKIAVQVDDAIECLALFKLLTYASQDGREMIAIAMGSAGIVTRILGPSRGAFLTYASLDDENVTAPGQMSATELRELYRVEKIDRQTQIFGLIGQPVLHSLSPRMHNAAFAATGTNAVYIPFETRDVKGFIKQMVHPQTRELDWNLRGLSVTAPHKSNVMGHLDWIEPAAREIGAVNTIVVEDDALHGYNTDAQGFMEPLAKMYGELRGARCAIIGAGGAARAALWSLKQARASVTIFARDAAKAGDLRDAFECEPVPLEAARFEGFDVVVNATPSGTRGQFENEAPATASQLRGARLVYDLVYNPTETRFLLEAREAGCQTLSGLSMLVAQAAAQFKLWTGTMAPTIVMHEAAIKGLKK
ncbi:MAG: shikimate dehydrogenase [Acidobacteriota bacterium]